MSKALENTRKNFKRNYGIDLFRIVAMFMIVNLHVLKHGGALERVSGTQFIVTWFIEAFITCAVNCYAIISGYAGYKEETVEIHYEKYIVLWLQVFIYSVGFTSVIQCISRTIELKELLKAFMPVTATQYWYFTAYTPVFFLAPWLKKFVYQLSIREAKTCLLILVAFVGYITLAGILYDPFVLSGGYSFIWLTVLFLVGALIKKTDMLNQVSTKKAWMVVCACVLLNWIQKLIIPSQSIFTSYISFTMVILAVALLAVFSKIKITSVWGQRIIKSMASATFGVYLIHDNIAIRNYFIKDQFTWIAYLEPWKIPIFVAVISLIIFAVCIVIDLGRGMLFNKLKIGEWSVKITGMLKRIFRVIGEK